MISSCTHAGPPWAKAHAWGHGEGPPTPARESLRQQLAAASLSTDSGLSIRITTDEGDVVTLSAQREVDLTLINYGERYKSGSEKSRIEIEASSFSVSSGIQLSVQGNLSDQERADIEALLQDLQPAVNEFLRTGQPVGVASPPGEKYESLSGVRLDMSSTQQFDLLAARFRSERTEATVEELVQRAAEQAMKLMRDLPQEGA